MIFAPGIPDLVRDTESVLSGYFSFSWSAPHLFGDRVEAFATAVPGAAAGAISRGRFLGLARRYQSDPCPEMTGSGSRVSLPPHPVGVLIPLSRDRHRSGDPGESLPRAPTESVRSR